MYDKKVVKSVLVQITKNIKIKDISKQFNIPVSTIYRWKKKNIELWKNIKASQEITILIEIKKYKEALDICNRKEFENNSHIQSQKITILMELKKYKEALDICDRKEFENNSHIQSYKKMKVLSMLESISLEEIKNYGFSLCETIILTVAYYEKMKYSQKNILSYLKTKIKEYNEDEALIKILKQLKNRFCQNIKFFDLGFYTNLLTKVSVQYEKEQLIIERNKLVYLKDKENNQDNKQNLS